MLMAPASALPLNPPRPLSHSNQFLSSCGVDANSGVKLCLGGIALHGYGNALHDLGCIITHHVATNHLQEAMMLQHSACTFDSRETGAKA